MSDKPFQDPAVSSNLSTVEKLRLLLDITKTISRSLDLDEVLNLVMDTLGSLIPYDAAGIYFADTVVTLITDIHIANRIHSHSGRII